MAKSNRGLSVIDRSLDSVLMPKSKHIRAHLKEFGSLELEELFESPGLTDIRKEVEDFLIQDLQDDLAAILNKSSTEINFWKIKFLRRWVEGENLSDVLVLRAKHLRQLRNIYNKTINEMDNAVNSREMAALLTISLKVIDKMGDFDNSKPAVKSAQLNANVSADTLSADLIEALLTEVIQTVEDNETRRKLIQIKRTVISGTDKVIENSENRLTGNILPEG